ncbi:MAG TPA: hypothetical protein VMM36_06495 [Opitutaceae bacterium]|nr:hypothetical protein [Opitutaceae bacterium]
MAQLRTLVSWQPPDGGLDFSELRHAPDDNANYCSSKNFEWIEASVPQKAVVRTPANWLRPESPARVAIALATAESGYLQKITFGQQAPDGLLATARWTERRGEAWRKGQPYSFT